MNGCQTTLLTREDKKQGKGLTMIVQQVSHKETLPRGRWSEPENHLLKPKTQRKCERFGRLGREKLPCLENGTEQELELAKESSFGAQSFGRYQGIKAQEEIKEWISAIELEHGT